MKRIAVTIGAFAVVALTGYAQGTINFNNGSSQLPGPPDPKVYLSDGVTGVSGVNYVAQLFKSADAGDASATAAVTEPPTTFFPSSVTSRAGVWAGGSRTFTDVAKGDTVSLIVRVWDSTLGTYAEATAGGANSYGQSGPFDYTVPAGNTPAPAEFFMTGFEGFALNVPEPSILALAGLGFAGILLRFRRK